MPSRIFTKHDFVKIFGELGVQPGMSVMIHARLSDLGYLVNGPDDIIDALNELVGTDGTLLVPSHSGQLTDPADWKNPSVPGEWVPIIRSNMMPFDPSRTPIRGRGVLAEYFLRYKGVFRSSHPLNSVAAMGKHAEYLTATHPLHGTEGEGSPCHKLYLSDGYILLLGVDLEASTCLHTAEFLADCKYLYEPSRKVLVRKNGKNEFVQLARYPDTSSKAFNKLRSSLRQEGHLFEYDLDGYTITLFSLKSAIDMALCELSRDPLYLKE